MIQKKLHLALFLFALLAILEKVIFMTVTSNWTALNEPVSDLLFGIGFIFFNTVAFAPFLFFARKPYDSIPLFAVDTLFFAGILWLSLLADYEIKTGTDAQTGLVYVGVPPLLIGAAVLLIFIHAAVYIIKKSSK